MFYFKIYHLKFIKIHFKCQILVLLWVLVLDMNNLLINFFNVQKIQKILKIHYIIVNLMLNFLANLFLVQNKETWINIVSKIKNDDR